MTISHPQSVAVVNMNSRTFNKLEVVKVVFCKFDGGNGQDSSRGQLFSRAPEKTENFLLSMVRTRGEGHPLTSSEDWERVWYGCEDFDSAPDPLDIRGLRGQNSSLRVDSWRRWNEERSKKSLLQMTLRLDKMYFTDPRWKF